LARLPVDQGEPSTKSIEEARAAHAAAWAAWLDWAGLEQKDPVRWSSG
jgi:hypothetical protein